MARIGWRRGVHDREARCGRVLAEADPDRNLLAAGGLVPARQTPLEQVALEPRGFVLGIAHDRLDARNPFDHAGQPPIVAQTAPVRADAPAPVGGAANVQDAVVFIAEAVDAGLGR